MSGTAAAAVGSACSPTLRASSSRKNGFPCALATMRSVSSGDSSRAAEEHRTTARLSSAESGGRVTWVAYERSIQAGRYPGR